ncbi:MAG: hypothetical protein AAB504_01120 [Patescibacteria group bacterium]
MKKIIFLSLVLSFLIVPFAQAKSISDLKIVYSDNINQKCRASESGYEQVRGCYIQEVIANQNPTFTIYLLKGLPKEVMNYVFLYSFGRFLVSNLSEEELKNNFHPAPEKLGVIGNDIKAYAAERFITWFYKGNVGEIQDNFFKKILVNIP